MIAPTAANCNPTVDQRESAGPASGLLGPILQTAREPALAKDDLSLSLQREACFLLDGHNSTESLPLPTGVKPASKKAASRTARLHRNDSSDCGGITHPPATVRLPPRTSTMA